MESLEEAMNLLLRERIQMLLHRIANRYNIDEEDLHQLLNVAAVEVATEDDSVKDVKFCNHKFTKGKRIGMTCLQKISSIHSGKCSKHQPKKSKIKNENDTTHLLTTDANGSDDELSIPEQFNAMSIALLHSDDDFNSE